VGNVDMLKLINEKALMQDSDQIKEAYMFDYLLQVNLTVINGMEYNEGTDEKQVKKSCANIFFKFQFLDLDGMLLTTDNQRKIVEEIHSKF
jgi:hypothetical protein